MIVRMCMDHDLGYDVTPHVFHFYQPCPHTSMLLFFKMQLNTFKKFLVQVSDQRQRQDVRMGFQVMCINECMGYKCVTCTSVQQGFPFHNTSINNLLKQFEGVLLILHHAICESLVVNTVACFGSNDVVGFVIKLLVIAEQKYLQHINPFHITNWLHQLAIEMSSTLVPSFGKTLTKYTT